MSKIETESVVVREDEKVDKLELELGSDLSHDLKGDLFTEG